IWSLVLTIPTIITGFYGMNVRLPFASDAISWIFTVLLMLGLMGIVAIMLRHRHFW
ncbi:magnesium transporter CorA family protein, partial [Levilactobacillus brevis]|nr:magnesium transporter CorA family protein [Levilactobacillus brevis]